MVNHLILDISSESIPESKLGLGTTWIKHDLQCGRTSWIVRAGSSQYPADMSVVVELASTVG